MSSQNNDDDPQDFLRKLLEKRGLLQRELADLAGRSPAWASQILNGRRRLRREAAERIANALNLDDAERWDLLHLAERNDSPAPPPQRRGGGEGLTLEHWFVSAIWEAARCEGYDPDPRWLAAVLRPQIDLDDARAALEFLQARGLLDEERRLPRHAGRRRGIRSSDKHTARILDLAGDALSTHPPNVRQHVSATVALSEEGWLTLLGRIQSTLAELLDHGDPDPPNRVYQISLAAHPVSLFTDSEAHPTEVE